jgi:hypothetical protein
VEEGVTVGNDQGHVDTPFVETGLGVVSGTVAGKVVRAEVVGDVLFRAVITQEDDRGLGQDVRVHAAEQV